MFDSVAVTLIEGEGMPPIGYFKQVCRAVGDLGGRASVQAIAEKLGWETSRVERVVAREEEVECPTLYFEHSAVVFTGSEIATRSKLYEHVERVLLHQWAQNRRLSNVEVAITAHAGNHGAGVWTHPDLVLSAYCRGTKPMLDDRELHSFEIEHAEGFDIRSVYQAHSHGRGATYSWVVFPCSSLEKPENVVSTAKELNVGLISFVRPGRWIGWKTVVEAKQRLFSETDRDEFCRSAGVKSA